MGEFDDLILKYSGPPEPGLYENYVKPALDVGEQVLDPIAKLTAPVGMPFQGVETAIAGLAGLATQGDPLAYMKLPPARGRMAVPTSPYQLAKQGIQTAIEGKPYKGRQGYAEQTADVAGEFGSQLALDPVMAGMNALGKVAGKAPKAMQGLIEAVPQGGADLAKAQQVVEAMKAGKMANRANTALGAAFVPGMAAGALHGVENTAEGYQKEGLTPEVFGEGLQTAADATMAGIGAFHGYKAGRDIYRQAPGESVTQKLASGLASLVGKGHVDIVTAAQVLKDAQNAAGGMMAQDVEGEVDVAQDHANRVTDRVGRNKSQPQAPVAQPQPQAPPKEHAPDIVDVLKALGWRDDQIAQIQPANAIDIAKKRNKPADFGLSGEGEAEAKPVEEKPVVPPEVLTPDTWLQEFGKLKQREAAGEDVLAEFDALDKRKPAQPPAEAPVEPAPLHLLPPRDLLAGVAPQAQAQPKGERTPLDQGEPKTPIDLENKPEDQVKMQSMEAEKRKADEVDGAVYELRKFGPGVPGQHAFDNLDDATLIQVEKKAEDVKAHPDVIGAIKEEIERRKVGAVAKPKPAADMTLDELKQEYMDRWISLADEHGGDQAGQPRVGELQAELKKRVGETEAERFFDEDVVAARDKRRAKKAPEGQMPPPPLGVANKPNDIIEADVAELKERYKQEIRDMEQARKNAKLGTGHPDALRFAQEEAEVIRQELRDKGLKTADFKALEAEADAGSELTRIRDAARDVEVAKKAGAANTAIPRLQEVLNQAVRNAHSKRGLNDILDAQMEGRKLANAAANVSASQSKLLQPRAPGESPPLPHQIEVIPSNNSPGKVTPDNLLREDGRPITDPDGMEYIRDVIKEHGVDLKVRPQNGRLPFLGGGAWHRVWFLGKATEGPHKGKDLILRVGNTSGEPIPDKLKNRPDLVLPIIATKNVHGDIIDITEYAWEGNAIGKSHRQWGMDVNKLEGALIAAGGKPLDMKTANTGYVWRDGKWKLVVIDYGAVARKKAQRQWARNQGILTEPNIGRAAEGGEKKPGHVSTQDVKDAFRRAKVTAAKLEGGQRGWTVELKNGHTITVRVEPGALLFAHSEVQKGHPELYPGGKPVPGLKVLGEWIKLDNSSIIRLAKEAGAGTLNHEVFHAAMDLALTAKEKAAVLREYEGKARYNYELTEPTKPWDKLSKKEKDKLTNEAAARGYEEWTPETPHTLFGKILKTFKDIYRSFKPNAESVFEKVKSGEALERDLIGKEATQESRFAANPPEWWKAEQEAEKLYQDKYKPLLEAEDQARSTFNDQPIAEERARIYDEYKALKDKSQKLKDVWMKGSPFLDARGDSNVKDKNDEFIKINLGLEKAKGGDFRAGVKKALRRAGVKEDDIKVLFQVYRDRPQDFQKVFQDVAQHKWGDYFLEAYKAGLVSGVPTKMANLASNLTMRGIRDLENVVAAGLDAARVKLLGGKRERYLGEFSAGWHGYLSEMPSAISDWVEGHKEMAQLKTPTQKGLGRHIGGGALDVDLARIGGAIPGKLGEFWRTGFKSLDVDDALFKHLSASQELYRSLYREGRQQGLSHAESIKNTQVAAKELSNNIKEGKIPRKYEALLKRLERVARGDTFQTQMEGLWRQGEAAVRSNKIVQGFIPFYRTPVNIMLQTLLRTPAGFAFGKGSLPELWRAGKEGRLSGEHMENLAKPMVGSMIAVGMVSAALKGVISGGGPQSYNEQEAKKETGWLPYAIHVGDKWVSYQRIEPLSSILGIAADMAEAGKYGDTETIGKYASRLTGSILENLTSKTFLAGLEGLFTALHDPKQYAERYIKQMEASIVPNIVSKTAQALDPVVRKTDTKNVIMSRIPGLSKKLEPRHTPTGQELQRPGSALERFASPFVRSEDKHTPEANVAREMERVGFAPGQVQDYMSPKGKKVYLTAEEKQTLLEAKQKATQALVRVVRDPSYQKLPERVDDAPYGARTKEATLRRVYERYINQARDRIRGKVIRRAREQYGTSPGT